MHERLRSGLRPAPMFLEEGIAVIVLAFSHYLVRFHFEATAELPLARLADLLRFEAHRPFVYRVLQPVLLRLFVPSGTDALRAAEVLE